MTDIPRLKGTFKNWLANAHAGESVIVQTAFFNAHIEAEAARTAGLITTCQKRAEGHTFHLIAVRLRHTVKPDKPVLGRGSIGSGLEKAAERKGHKPETLARIKEAARLHAAGMTYAEIAPHLGVAANTVKDYMACARNAGLA